MRLGIFPAIVLVACVALLVPGQVSGPAAAPLLPPLPADSARDHSLPQTSAQSTTLVAAVLPAARAVPVGTSATALVTVINSGPAAALDVGIAPSTPIPASFSLQATDPLTNGLPGTPNTPVSIAAGQKQTFFIAITPSHPFASTDVTFAFSGNNTEPVSPLSGVNTLQVAATSGPGPDIVALGVTPSGDGILTIDGTTGTAALALATMNVGTGGMITVSADTGSATLPLDLSVCQTHPATGQCISPAAPTVTMSIGAGDTPTFAVFATADDDVPLDPAVHRVFVRFKDDAKATRGATSAAVQARKCAPGSQPRLTIVNHCDDPVWAVMTAPGTPSQVAVAAQWDWMDPHLTHRYFVTTGAQGSIALHSRSLTMNATPAPNPTLVKGMIITVVGAGPSGTDLTTKIDKVDSDAITLAKKAKTAVTNTPVSYYASQGAFSIKTNRATTVCVPDKGAPSGNFRFFMGCPALGDADTDPFNASGCVIGSASGDLSGINTLFEPSFGCIPPLSGSDCAFNASDSAPKCQADPNGANCGPLSETDYYDISAVDGYTFALRVDATPPRGGTCSALSKDASMLDLASCPSEDGRTLHSADATQQALITGGISLLTTTTRQTSSGPVTSLQSCAAPYKWFETTSLGSPPNPTLTTPNCSGGSCNAVSFYAAAGCDPAACTPCATGGDPPCKVAKCTSCPGGSGPQQKVGPKGTGEKAIQNTNFVQGLRALGYRGYTWQYDDGVGGQTCTPGSKGAKLNVTLCPSGSSPRPYQSDPLWTFSLTTGTCSTDGSTGMPNGRTTFKSLFDCQAVKMQYTCTDLTASDPFDLPIGIWAADPVATLTPTPLSRRYAAFQRKQKLKCQDFTVNPGIPSAGEMLVPNCTYYFKFNEKKDIAKVCPGPDD